LIFSLPFKLALSWPQRLHDRRRRWHDDFLRSSFFSRHHFRLREFELLVIVLAEDGLPWTISSICLCTSSEIRIGATPDQPLLLDRGDFVASWTTRFSSR
jgi:hypothetical protein